MARVHHPRAYQHWYIDAGRLVVEEAGGAAGGVS